MKRQKSLTKCVIAFALTACLLTLTACGATEPPTEHPILIAHAGGAIHGYRLTNSLEAIDNAYENGFRFIELDMELTSDGEIVMIHDWDSMAKRMLFSEGIRTYDEFLSSDTLMDFTLLDLDTLLGWLNKHTDCCIITDVKAADNAEILEEIIADCDDDISLMQRFIPQAYSFEEYDEISALGFRNIILTLYRMDTDVGTLADFAQNSSPWAITIPEERVTEELITAISEKGTNVYSHTINSLDFFETWQPLGLTGIYTDYFQPNWW